MDVTKPTILKRINRALAREDHSTMRVARQGSAEQKNFGNYFVVRDRVVVAAHIDDLAAFAMECGCIKPYERLVERN
jgi:hypothetical protein